MTCKNISQAGSLFGAYSATLNCMIGLLLFISSSLFCQVPVREEPLHKLVLQNKYIRLLDVWIAPGDTSLYHIHETPSLFTYYTNTSIMTQIKGEEWKNELTIAGKAWYRSFSPDTLIHRVCNVDTTALHVIDIELLSRFDSNEVSRQSLLPFPLLFENERAVAYQLTETSFQNQKIEERGPMIVELISGDGATFHNATTDQNSEIKTGQYLFIEPGTSFSFKISRKQPATIVLFELK